ncbi:MAG: hypothetical protein E7C60_03820 [Clostridium perfringens]|nr:hypothetical protein [Clostridium perfringens]MDU2657005.1 hypothetical protein [Clostridium perfringens]
MEVLFDLKEFIEDVELKYIKNARVVAYENKGVFFEIEVSEKFKELTEDDQIALIICIRKAISMDERINSLFKDIPFVVKEVE